MNVPSRKEVKMRPTKWTEAAIKKAFDDFCSNQNIKFEVAL